eukprot:gnl/Ergobibamus_cyprinoides/4856.p1 GENE.gnl/Ergobibamus_cyprinoides/4856~~gnl/Ergobibamus_cyprinoides/4856.p1  ORF type:complete len:166 (-),score=18.08 gnl/Ergobibamus_cyprinoides/4856:96-593(-)
MSQPEHSDTSSSGTGAPGCFDGTGLQASTAAADSESRSREAAATDPSELFLGRKLRRKSSAIKMFLGDYLSLATNAAILRTMAKHGDKALMFAESRREGQPPQQDAAPALCSLPTRRSTTSTPGPTRSSAGFPLSHPGLRVHVFPSGQLLRAPRSHRVRLPVGLF